MSVGERGKALVDGDRQADYGDPCEAWDRIALAWSGVLGVEVTGKQAALCMAAMKVCREAIKPKQDNRTDAAGYIEIADRYERRKP